MKVSLRGSAIARLPSHEMKNSFEQQQQEFVNAKLNNLRHQVGKIDTITTQNGQYSTIVKRLKQGDYHIIYFAANLFYLPDNPSESYFLTADEKTISLNDIIQICDLGKKFNQIQGLDYIPPLLIFDGQILGPKNTITRSFQEISSLVQFYYKIRDLIQTA